MKNILEMIDFKRLIVLDKSEKDEDMSIKFVIYTFFLLFIFIFRQLKTQKYISQKKKNL